MRWLLQSFFKQLAWGRRFYMHSLTLILKSYLCFRIRSKLLQVCLGDFLASLQLFVHIAENYSKYLHSSHRSNHFLKYIILLWLFQHRTKPCFRHVAIHHSLFFISIVLISHNEWEVVFLFHSLKNQLMLNVWKTEVLRLVDQNLV